MSLIKRLVNRSKDLLFIAPLLPFWRRQLRGKAMVYLYHRIEQEGDRAFLDNGGSPVTPAELFRKDIQTLKSLGAKFVRFSDLAHCDYSSGDFFVAICVDDGFKSNYETGQDVADSEEVPQTIFQCSAMVEPEVLIWEHQLYYLFEHSDKFKTHLTLIKKWPNNLDEVREQFSAYEIQAEIDTFLAGDAVLKQAMRKLVKNLYPDKNDVVEASAAGHEIASHGHFHCNRFTLTDEQFVEELERSKTILQSIIQKPVSAFSYPFSKYKKTDPQLCAQFYSFIGIVDNSAVDESTPLVSIPRNTYPGKPRNKLRHRRWLLTGSI